MKVRYANFGEFNREHEALHRNADLQLIKVWEVSKFNTGMEEAADSFGFNGLSAWQENIRSAIGLPSGSAKRTYNYGSPRMIQSYFTLEGDHVKKKLEKCLIEMTAAFKAKAAKGRAATTMICYRSHDSVSRATEYYFVLATSDTPYDIKSKQWTPTGNHEAIAWSWPATEGSRAAMDRRDILGL